MGNLSLHIEYLLTRHDCVIVPSFGAFIRERREAYISDNKIIPPGETLRFNSEIRHNDGLLTGSYSRKRGIDMSEAQCCVENDVNSLLQQLRCEKEMSFGHLGILSVENGSELNFSPFHTLEERSNLLGMPMRKLFSNETKLDKKEPIPTEIHINSEKNIIKKDYINFRISKRFLKTASAVAIILAVAISALLGIQKPDINHQQASIIPTSSIATAIEKADKAIKIVSNETAPTETIVSETPAPLPLHHLIVATFATEQDAKKYITSKENCKHHLYIVSGGKYHRVSAACSDNREDIQKLLNSKEIRTEFNQAWIWDEK